MACVTVVRLRPGARARRPALLRHHRTTRPLIAGPGLGIGSHDPARETLLAVRGELEVAGARQPPDPGRSGSLIVKDPSIGAERARGPGSVPGGPGGRAHPMGDPANGPSLGGRSAHR